MNRPSYGGTVLQRYAQIFHRPIRIKRQRIIVNIKLNNGGFTVDEYAGNQAKLSLKTVVKRKQLTPFLTPFTFLTCSYQRGEIRVFEKFGVLCLLMTTVLKFPILPLFLTNIVIRAKMSSKSQLKFYLYRFEHLRRPC